MKVYELKTVLESLPDDADIKADENRQTGIKRYDLVVTWPNNLFRIPFDQYEGLPKGT